MRLTDAGKEETSYEKTMDCLSEHSFDVAAIAHGLAVLGNTRFGKQYNCERVALLGLFHDTSEIITGDLPTPVKYYDDEIKQAYKKVEDIASRSLLQMIPDDLSDSYSDLLLPNEADLPLWRLVKAADKISAYIKCVEEESAGNREFVKAKQTLLQAIEALDSEEANAFLDEFMPSFEKTLDEQ